MAPNNTSTPTAVVFENDQQINAKKIKESQINGDYKIQLVWFNIFALSFLHVGALYGIYLTFTSAKMATIIFAYFLVHMTGFSITAGAHRLWSHRTYKAKLPLQLLLMFFFTMANQMPILVWVKNHRLHHKYSETNADPHNARRGFFFAHIGWLLCRKRPEAIEKGKGIDINDLLADPMIRFQNKYFFTFLMPLCCFILPTVIPIYFWNETWSNAFYIAAVLRWATIFNKTGLVNSAAHIYGNKPYDKNIWPGENLGVSLLAYGEGWHNYHHAFPWDYKTSELGKYSLNTTNAFIDFFAWIGFAYDLKTVSSDMIKQRVLKTGDGSHELWGWGDKDITEEDKEATIITHKRIS